MCKTKPYCRIRAYASCYAAEEHAVSFDVVEPSIRNKERVIQSLRSEPEVMYPGIGFYIQTALDV